MMSMTEELQRYAATIKKKHSFGWTPKYEEKFATNINKIVFIPLAIQTFKELGWNLVYQEENSIEARRKRDLWQWGQQIIVSYDYGIIKVRSVSLGNEFWDMGRNSKRVKLFIHAFQEIAKTYDKKALSELEKETERKNNWDDYKIPENLPLPIKQRKPQLWIPIVFGIVGSLLIAFIIALLSFKLIYLIALYEIAVAFALGFVLKYAIKASNYTHFDSLKYLLIGMIALVYFFNQYFQYLLFLSESGYHSLGFLDFIELRLKAGLTVKSTNTGWIGMVISWAFQLGFTYIFGVFRLGLVLTNYVLDRIPMEVVDFAFYHFVKGKSEEEVRSELSKMRWSDRQDQDEVFESIGAIQGSAEFNKFE